MRTIGEASMPADFQYRDTFIKGKPQHGREDPFRSRHPSMDVERRAKIFAPFDALKGFDEAVSAKDVLYEDKKALNPEESAELNRRLRILYDLTYNSRMARANRVQVSVTYYEACDDVNREEYGVRGRYRTVSGICLRVDAGETQTILLGEAHGRGKDEMSIPLENIRKIESPGDWFRGENLCSKNSVLYEETQEGYDGDIVRDIVP